MLPDVLSDYPRHKRMAKEHEDGEFIKTHPELVRTASAAALKRDSNTWAGIDVFASRHFKPFEPGDEMDFIVCARIDLDHPMYFPDNKVTDCADCGCELQYRPDAPEGAKLCVCCCARRMRGEGY